LVTIAAELSATRGEDGIRVLNTLESLYRRGTVLVAVAVVAVGASLVEPAGAVAVVVVPAVDPVVVVVVVEPDPEDVVVVLVLVLVVVPVVEDPGLRVVRVVRARRTRSVRQVRSARLDFVRRALAQTLATRRSWAARLTDAWRDDAVAASADAESQRAKHATNRRTRAGSARPPTR
jgi:hypothetical protein